jgi:hypothetical protein
VGASEGLGIEGDDIATCVHKMADDGKALTAFDDGCLWLIRKTQHADRTGSRVVRVNCVKHALHLVLVQRIGGLSQLGSRANRAGQHGERHVVPRKARSTVADGPTQILAPDSRIASDGLGDDVDVGPGKPVSYVGEHVGVRNLRRHKRVDGDFRQLRVDEAHAPDQRLVIAGLVVDRLEHVPCLGIRFTDQDHVG